MTCMSHVHDTDVVHETDVHDLGLLEKEEAMRAMAEKKSGNAKRQFFGDDMEKYEYFLFFGSFCGRFISVRGFLMYEIHQAISMHHSSQIK